MKAAPLTAFTPARRTGDKVTNSTDILGIRAPTQVTTHSGFSRDHRGAGNTDPAAEWIVKDRIDRIVTVHESRERGTSLLLCEWAITDIPREKIVE